MYLYICLCICILISICGGSFRGSPEARETRVLRAQPAARPGADAESPDAEPAGSASYIGTVVMLCYY